MPASKTLPLQFWCVKDQEAIPLKDGDLTRVTLDGSWTLIPAYSAGHAIIATRMHLAQAVA